MEDEGEIIHWYIERLLKGNVDLSTDSLDEEIDGGSLVETESLDFEKDLSTMSFKKKRYIVRGHRAEI